MFFVFIRTIYDIGLVRIILRIKFLIKLSIQRRTPLFFAHFLTGFNKNKIPKWVSGNEIDKKYKLPKPEAFQKKSISFDFINIKNKLSFPLIWNNSSWPRLWQFHIHYFDWSTEWIEYYIRYKIWPDKASNLEYLIDSWIKNNTLKYGDGWNSYTTSLRIRNWIKLFIFCPELLNSKRRKSLWEQICFLNANKEEFIGGNHYIENLTALIIGSLHFENNISKRIYNDSLYILRSELHEQIFYDGGHMEGSASYHILILDRLTELGCFLEIKKGLRLNWLVENISKMTQWCEEILFHDQIPRFNDSSVDNKNNILAIINFAKSYLSKENKFLKKKSIRQILIKSLPTKKEFIINQFRDEHKKKAFIDLKDTGWAFFRPGNGWQVVMKYKQCCPKYLPAHLHSDLMSIEIFFRDIPIIAEVGTSTYQKSKDRQFERSSAGHNIFQLGVIKNNKEDINWVEPIEVWSSFKAGRKAKTTSKKFAISNKITSLSANHNGYKHIRATYKREVSISKGKNNEIVLIICDNVFCKKVLAWRQIWHLGPNQNEKIIKKIGEELKRKYHSEYEIIDTWYATDFNKKIFRKSIFNKGVTKPGLNKFELKIPLKMIVK